MIDPYHHLSTLAKTRVSSRIATEDYDILNNLLPYHGAFSLIINTHVKRIADTVRRTGLTYPDILADPSLLDQLLLGGTVAGAAGTRRPNDGPDVGRGTIGSGRSTPPASGTASPLGKAQGTAGGRRRQTKDTPEDGGQSGK